ncbi:uncharacterized protein BKCO1_6400034 [Diplodia corticola]|uniref:Uncharacterized protein n=1 Tax=Diplodia corticola TaxID=236234 RepID=A0A1J9RQP0_9PEZI|nr:uncharacterized protein BKCO1_6400034 [Diplodia corticola]OJD30220.1 hypothetical protein BKCO1_6400034 [Diplodia corticola]
MASWRSSSVEDVDMAYPDNPFFTEEAARTLGLLAGQSTELELDKLDTYLPTWEGATQEPDVTRAPTPTTAAPNPDPRSPVDLVEARHVSPEPSSLSGSRRRRSSSTLSNIVVAIPSPTLIAAKPVNDTMSASSTSAAQRTPEEQDRYYAWLRENSLHRFSTSSRASSKPAAASPQLTSQLATQSLPSSNAPAPEQSHHPFLHPTSAKQSAALLTSEPGAVSSASKSSPSQTSSSDTDSSTASSPQHKQRDPPPRPQHRNKKTGSSDMSTDDSTAPATTSPPEQTKPKVTRHPVSYSGGPPTKEDRRAMNSLRCNKIPLTALLRRYATLVVHFPTTTALHTLTLYGRWDDERDDEVLAADALAVDISPQLTTFGVLEAEVEMVRRKRAGVNGALDREKLVKEALAGGWVEVRAKDRREGVDVGFGRMGEELVLRRQTEDGKGEVRIDVFREVEEEVGLEVGGRGGRVDGSEGGDVVMGDAGDDEEYEDSSSEGSSG